MRRHRALAESAKCAHGHVVGVRLNVGIVPGVDIAIEALARIGGISLASA